MLMALIKPKKLVKRRVKSKHQISNEMALMRGYTADLPNEDSNTPKVTYQKGHQITPCCV